MAREMKDSGIEWIGEIPKEWSYCKLKNYYNFEKGKNAAIYTQEYIGAHLGVFPVYSGQTENNGVMGSIDTYDYDIQKCLFTTTVGAKVMTPKILKGRFSLSQNCLIMKKAKECCIEFFYYALLPLFDYEKSLIPSYMQPSLRIEDLKKYGFYIPNLPEQEKIAKFLDSECAKIDEVISKTKSTIEEYKKLKQSVITEAVTKGIRANREMKDSGIEWIGEIPKEWEVRKFKYVAGNLIKGNGITKEDVIENGDTPCVRYGEIYSKYNNSFSKCVSRTNSDIINAKQYFSHGDILFVGTGELVEEIGKNIVYLGEEQCLCGGDIIIAKNNKNHNSAFINYAMNSNCSQAQKSSGKTKLKVVHISAADISNVIIAFPDKLEQDEIVKYLDEKCAIVDSIIENKSKIISELEVLKKSLIYEYVTGKKEVV